ncbi:unnamed protein product [Arabidopsis halleri]
MASVWLPGPHQIRLDAVLVGPQGSRHLGYQKKKKKNVKSTVVV